MTVRPKQLKLIRECMDGLTMSRLRNSKRLINDQGIGQLLEAQATQIFEPPRGKTKNVVSEQVRHKSGCTVTEKS